MEPSRFDDLTKALATATSRRQALKAIAATTLGGILGLAGIGTAFADKTCKNLGQGCNNKKNLCCPGLLCQGGVCVAAPTTTTTTTAPPTTTTPPPCIPSGGSGCFGPGQGNCCAGLVCDMTTSTCVSCIPNGDKGCNSGDCCAGLVCDTTTFICAICIPTTGQGCNSAGGGASCCSGNCDTTTDTCVL